MNLQQPQRDAFALPVRFALALLQSCGAPFIILPDVVAFPPALSSWFPRAEIPMRRMMTFCGLTLLLLVSQVFGYGDRGHHLVGAIADRRLQSHNPAVSAKVKDLLDDLTLERVAVYPDKIIKMMDSSTPDIVLSHFPELSEDLRNDLTKYWLANHDKPLPPPHENRHKMAHYTDVSVVGPHQYTGTGAGQTPFDICHAIPRCVRVLRGTDTADDQERKISKSMAVILLAHFLGDIHQPLHVGAAYFDFHGQPVDPSTFQGALEDEGGNRIHFKFSPPMSADSPNLHSFWDNATVNIAFANDDDSNANELASSEPASWQLPSSVVVEDWPKAWANEILSVAKAAHTPIVFQGMHTTHNGEHIFQAKIDSNTYPPMAGAAVRKAIHKAGWRLAALLEAALQE